MDTKTLSLKARIAEDRLKADVVMADIPNPTFPESDAWRITLRGFRRKMLTPFWTGRGWSREPTIEDVPECLLSDAASIENARSFEDWASDMGFDTDSRKAKKTYHDAKAQTEKLRHFLGDRYESYLWYTTY